MVTNRHCENLIRISVAILILEAAVRIINLPYNGENLPSIKNGSQLVLTKFKFGDMNYAYMYM